MSHQQRSLLVILSASLLTLGCEGQMTSVDSNASESEPSEMIDAGTMPDDSSGPGQIDAQPDLVSMPDMTGDVDMPDMAEEQEEPKLLAGNEIPTSQQPLLFTCVGEEQPSPARLRLVDRTEWRKNVSRSAAGTGLSPFDPLAAHDYSTYTDGETINADILDVYINMSSSAAEAWRGPGNWDRSLRWSSPFKHNPMLVANVNKVNCLINETSGTPDDACIEGALGLLLEHAVLYRPPSREELDSLKEYAAAALAKESATPTRDERSQTMRKIVQAAWMMTGALFRQEGFAQQPDASGISYLDDWEIAHALAYALVQSAPGSVVEYSEDASGRMSDLVTAARDGVLHKPETIEAMIDLYFAHNTATNTRRSIYRSSDGVQNFFREWLGYMAYLEGSKDNPSATTAYDSSTINTTYHFAVNGPRHSGSSQEPQLFYQLDDMIARILYEDQDVFRQLLTTRDYYVAADVGSDGGSPNLLYNLANSTEPTQEGRWVTMPESERAGVLTHPAWLASHSLNFENDPNPVHRGKWVREMLLCENLPPVPVTVAAALDPETKDLSTRERVKQKTEQIQCIGCHNLMNPLGYPFEVYNHIGIMRETDHGNMPDGSSVLVEMPDESLNGPVRDAVDMSEKLAESNYVKRCFIRQSFRYFMGREETMQDACVLASMETAYDDQGGSFKAMLKALFTSQAFLARQHPELAQPE